MKSLIILFIKNYYYYLKGNFLKITILKEFYTKWDAVNLVRIQNMKMNKIICQLSNLKTGHRANNIKN